MGLSFMMHNKKAITYLQQYILAIFKKCDKLGAS